MAPKTDPQLGVTVDTGDRLVGAGCKDADGKYDVPLVDNDGHLQVDVLSGASGGTQYADGAARGTATGTLAMGDDGTNIQSVHVDSAGDLQIDVLTIAAGNNNIGDIDVASIAAGDNNIGNVDIASIAAGDNNIGNVDIVTLPALAAGTNNIGDVDVASIAAGDNNIGNVDLASAIPAGTNNIGDVDIASIAAGDNNIGNVDIVSGTITTVSTVTAVTTVSTLTGGGVAHDSADSGNPIKVGAKAFSPDGTTPGAVAENDRSDAKCDLNGRIYVNTRSPQSLHKHLDGTSAYTDESVIADPGDGFQAVITAISFSSGEAVAINFFLEEGSTKIFGPIYIEAVAGRGFAMSNLYIPCTASTAVTLTTSAANDQSFDMDYFIQAV